MASSIQAAAQQPTQQEQLPPVTVTGAPPSSGQYIEDGAGSLTIAPQPAGFGAAPSTAPPQNRNDPGTNGFVASLSGVATKAPGTILDTPRSISTATKAEIEERNAMTVSEALQYASGVNAYYYSHNFVTRDQHMLRGFLAYQFVDGLKQHDSNWGIEPYGLERIDVLKGPAANMYGQGSPGGVVALTSKRPTDEAFTEVVLQAGTHNKLQTGVDFGGPVGNSGVVTYRLTAMRRIADGEVDFTETDRVYIAPAVTIRPSSATSLTLLSSYQHDPSITAQQLLPRFGSILPGPNGQYIPRDNFLGEPGYHDSHIRSFKIGYELRHRFNETWSFEQDAGYRKVDVALREVIPTGAVSGTRAVRQIQNIEYEIENYQVDTRLRGRFSTGPLEHRLVAGIDYAAIPNYQGRGVSNTAANPFLIDFYNPVHGQALSIPAINDKRDQDVKQTGIYIQDEISIAGLTVSAGLRHDWASGDETRRVAGADGVFGAATVTPVEDQELTYNLGAIYHFANGFAPYVSYSTSFFPTVGSTAGGAPFLPTTGEQKELGFKYQPRGFNALFTAAVFDLVQQNVLTADPNNPGQRIQIGEVAVQGAEFEVRASLTDGWNVAAAYTYLDSEVTKVSRLEAARLGKAFVSVPEHSASLWTSYTFSEGAFRGLTLGGGVRYFGKTAGDAANTFFAPSFTLYDAMARYDLGVFSPELEDWELAINAKNLADERYVTNCVAATACVYGMGRTVDAALRMRF
ncbi:MAG TPA: TonB-dependent siderophore receptor [Hyphomicrobium sp.]|nr:TonB-dependent siderophore receptor [Hyphomicrobium sp.]